MSGYYCENCGYQGHHASWCDDREGSRKVFREEVNNYVRTRLTSIQPPDEITQLRTALAASQARERKLREALAGAMEWNWMDDGAGEVILPWVRETLSLPQDDSALRGMIEAAKAEERERIIQLLAGIDQTEIESEIGWWETSTGAAFGADILAKIRARKSPT